MALCKTLRIGRVPITGFQLSANVYEGLGPFTTNLTIRYPAGVGKRVIIVTTGDSTDSCGPEEVVLDSSGNGTISSYSVQTTKTIYAMVKEGTCCTDFIYPPCLVSNYASFVVTPVGNVEFISIPESDAEIWLAPSPGQTPEDILLTTTDTISNIIVGTYDYIIKKTGYNDASGNITILENQTATVTVPMTPAEGCIYFDSIPQTADIWIDGSVTTVIDTGFNTPKLICGLSLGSHVFKLKLAGYDDVADTAILMAGSGLIITKTLRQSPILTDIIISPINPSVVIDDTQSFSATPLDQYGDPFPAIVTWNNSNSFVGNIDSSTGLFTALHTGTTIITATSGNVSKSTTLTVTPLVPILTTIIVSPANISIVANNAAIFTATTLDQLNNPISATVTWSSSNPTIGIVDQNGVFLALSQGTTIITATSEDGTISGIAVANVTPAAPVEIPVLTKITISPLSTSLAVGIGTIFVASTLDQFNNPISATVIWDSSNPNIGTIDQNGIFYALSPGITTITATSEDETVSGVAIANVTTAIPSAQPILTRITVSPLITSLTVDNSTIFTASTLDQFGNSIYATVIWGSTNSNVGMINQNGVFTAISPGITTITATNEDETISGVAIANVTPSIPAIQPVLTRITISPLTITTAVNNSTIFVATTLDQFNNPIYSPVTWSSSNPTVGTIDQNGIFTALSPGTTTITATGEDGTVSGIAIANVTSAVPTIQPILTKITIEPLTTTILINNSTVFVASTLDQFGNSTATIVTWSSSDTNVGTINQNGIFSALNVGKTTITASSENIIGVNIIGVALVNVVKTLPGPTGGILGNINTAALILGTAVVGAVITYKGSKEKEIEKQADIAKREIDKAIELERIREREMKLLSKKNI